MAADSKKKTPVDDTPRSFAHFLAGLGDGDAQAELSVKLTKLVEEMYEHNERAGKTKGQIKLTLGFTIEKGLAEVTYDVDVKAPKPLRRATIFWPGANGSLSTKNPRQQELPLRSVDGPATRELPDDGEEAAR